MSANPPILIDACVAINIFASDIWGEVFSACALTPVVALQAARESLWVLDEFGERVEMDIAAMARKGLLEIWTPLEHELALLVALAARLGDGEAASLAIAHARGLGLASDDRLARREAEQRGIGELHSTAGLMRAWSQAARPAPATITRALVRIRCGASYLPAPGDPDRGWWARNDPGALGAGGSSR
ncbi:MAG: hypothetical protein ACLPUT_10935 [Solirubrobacteraceae bacterium]